MQSNGLPAAQRAGFMASLDESVKTTISTDSAKGLSTDS